jgi:hypothetical protein
VLKSEGFRILEKLQFPAEIGRCHGNPLLFFDTNVLIDADEFVKQLFIKSAPQESVPVLLPVICDFIEGELLNLKKTGTLEDLKGFNYDGYIFESSYNSRDGVKRALEDMPISGMKEAVLVEYDKKLDPSGMRGETKEAKRASSSKSKFVDFSLITVASICAFRRKKLSVVISRDRWIKLSCKSLEEKFKLPILCYDQWTFSIGEILDEAR